MGRAWHTWVAFGLCMAIVLGAIGWISLAVLRLDRSEVEARRRAVVEENVRLALWRMDSAVAPLIAEENARPYFDYSPFYPAERAYTRMFAKIERGDVLMPSPLLTSQSPHVLIHFQVGPKGEVTSPQVPKGNMRDLAEGGYTTHENVLAAGRRLDELQAFVDREVLLGLLPRSERRSASAPARLATLAGTRGQQPQIDAQMLRNTAEVQRRASNMRRQLAAPSGRRAAPRAVASDVREGLISPLWLDSALLLARRVTVDGQEYVQGCWLDWPAIRRWLVEGVEDLLPEAALEPADAVQAGAGPRMLAALPVKLVPGRVPAEPAAGASAIQLSLIVAWGCVLLAAAAVAVVLRGAVVLSERRAAFVSAVTHELRTPLTTFRMYTEMLSEGRVPDEAKRQDYLNTLRAEAERLGHLVENVLAYARLERGRASERVETVTLKELFARVTDRLTHHARHAGMALVVEAEAATLQRPVRVDISAVEQILFNLVDNACKYAAGASDKRIHLQADLRNDHALVGVRDHGPGITGRDARRVFRPFSRSARDGANPAPGVGLGLALCRRLARRMGAELWMDRTATKGACFVLRLPIGQAGT